MGVTCAAMNPLDTLKVRWQSASADISSATTLSSFGRRILTEEGLLRGLWAPGLTANVAFLTSMGTIKMGIYPIVRDGMTSALGKESKTPATMLGAGVAAGSLSYVATAPLLQIKTKLVVRAGVVTDGVFQSGNLKGKSASGLATSAVGEAMTIWRHGGVAALWSGWALIVTRGALLTVGQVAAACKWQIL